MLAKLVPTFAGRGCRVVSETDPHGRILGFLDRSRYHLVLRLMREAIYMQSPIRLHGLVLKHRESFFFAFLVSSGIGSSFHSRVSALL
jgi:hypothetical protein